MLKNFCLFIIFIFAYILYAIFIDDIKLYLAFSFLNM